MGLCTSCEVDDCDECHKRREFYQKNSEPYNKYQYQQYRDPPFNPAYIDR